MTRRTATKKIEIEYLDAPPIGWFALDVLPHEDPRKRKWVGLMIDVHPDELKHCRCKMAWLYVHPKDYKPPRARRRLN
jgi:hypothetical protein